MSVPYRTIRFFKQGSPKTQIVEINSVLGAGGRPGVWVSGSQNFLLHSENVSETYNRQYSDGSIFAPPRYAGRSFSIDLMFIGDRVFQDLIEIEADFMEASSTNLMSIEYAFRRANGSSENRAITDCRLERFDLQEQRWGREKDMVVARLFFTSKNP